MSTCACVLSKNGERLMPTIRLGKVRHLLKDGKAKIIKHHPFTIQLLYDSKTDTQPIEICEDVGYNYIGISVKSESHEYVSVQYDTLQDEKYCHDSCRKMRRIRRNRLRYRKPRFDNRKRNKDWLAPSLEHMFKDDFLYISYQHPISSCPLLDIYLSSPDSKLYDEVIFGGIIPHFVRFAEQYSLYDCTSIWSQIEEKRAWLKANYPTDYQHEVLIPDAETFSFHYHKIKVP